MSGKPSKPSPHSAIPRVAADIPSASRELTSQLRMTGLKNMAQNKRAVTGVRSPKSAGDSDPGDVGPSLLARSGSLLAKLSQLREQGGLSAASSKTPSIVIFMIPFHYYYLAGKLSAVPYIFVYTSTETCGVSLVFREKQLHFLFYRWGSVIAIVRRYREWQLPGQSPCF